MADDIMELMQALVTADEEDPRIQAIKKLMGTPAMYKRGGDMGGYSPRDVLSSRALDRTANEENDPFGPPGFRPKFRSGQFNPRDQREAEYFRRYVGDDPGTDSEVELIYGEGKGSDQNVMRNIPTKGRKRKSTEQEMQDIYEQMDQDARYRE